MKAVVLATFISVADMRVAPQSKPEGGRAERKRFTEADLEEMFGPLESAAVDPALLDDPCFIPWRPEAANVAA